MIKVVSFDIGGTLLVGTEENASFSLKNLSEVVKLPYEDVRKAYKDVFQKSKGSFDELVESFCSILNISKSEELLEFFKNKFNITDNLKVSSENIDLLKKIKSMGYKIILFSNNCCLLPEIDKKVLNYVDGTFYSYELGFTKNDDEAYRIVEKELNCLPEEFLHIGDNLKSDYLKPKENGWNAILFGESKEDIQTIQKLDEVIKYLS